ncbi:MAG: hypothetical protein V2A66_08305 [Pseudomonadota bacterium]
MIRARAMADSRPFWWVIVAAALCTIALSISPLFRGLTKGTSAATSGISAVSSSVVATTDSREDDSEESDTEYA